MKTTNDYFTTSDLGLVSSLIASGYRVSRIDRSRSNRAVFLIKRNNKLNDLVSAYFNHQLKVDALTFFNSMKELKTRIYHT
jgi:hypothetical protein